MSIPPGHAQAVPVFSALFPGYQDYHEPRRWEIDKDFKQVTLSTKLNSVMITICLQTAQQICLSPH